jgi:beta-glucosidase
VQTRTLFLIASTSCLACGNHAVNVGTVAKDPLVTAEGGDGGGGGGEVPGYVFVDYGSTDTENLVAPAVCDGSNSGDALALFKYAPGYQPDAAVKQRVKDTLTGMTLMDKATQMRGMPYGSAGKTQMTDVQRGRDTKEIRGFHFRDGTRGMNLAEDMNGSKPNAATVDGTKVGFSTAFPVGVARGAAFDLDLEYAVGEAIADEMQAAKETVLLAPFVDLVRHPLWGRAQESYGEDPFHLGRLGSAMAVGIQQHIAASAVHFTGYNIEFGRDFNNMTIDEQTLRELYGRQYRMVVQDGGVAGIMTAYNKVNGVKATVNKHLLTDILRTDFGFQGFAVSDWWAMDPQTDVNIDTTTLKRYAISALTAGLDVEMPWALNYAQLESIVNSEAGLTQADIDRSAARVLEQKFRFNADGFGNVGLGTPKTTYGNGRINNNDYHVWLARQAALEGMVLLKNEAGTLPIQPTVKKVAVLGAAYVPTKTKNDGKVTSTYLSFATDVLTGDMGSSRVFHDPAKGVGPSAGIQKTAPSGVVVVTGTSAADAADADFVVVVAGLTPEDEGEEYTLAGDRDTFAMDDKQIDPNAQNIQNDLIASVAALGKPMVVVLEGGSVIDMPWLDRVPAVVMAWYPGMVGGEAMGMLLWGQANFSGKLPITWGRPSDYPPLRVYNNPPDTSLDYYVGYRYFDKNAIVPLYPFGHGLSYTTFAYKKLQLGCTGMSQGAVLPVVVNVANTGSVAGDETVMVFVSYPDSFARRPAKELKGFVRVRLEPGQEKQVTIPVRLQDLDYFATDPVASDTGKWAVESGEVVIKVGGSAANLPLEARVKVQGY